MYKLIVFVVLALIVGDANAVPVAAAAVMAAVAQTAVSYWALALTVLATVVTTYQQKAQQRKARAQYNASLKDKLLNIRSATAPRKLVLGRCRVGGAVLLAMSRGQHKETLDLIVEMAGHEVDGFDQYFFDDEVLAVDAQGWVQNSKFSKTDKTDERMDLSAGQTVTLPADYVPGSVHGFPRGGEFAPPTINGATVTAPTNCRIRYQRTRVKATFARVRGYPNGEIPQELRDLYPNELTATDRLSGVAFVWVTLNYDPELFQGPPNVSALVRGLKVSDPRTPGAPPVWTRNPALLLYGGLRHTLGAALADSDFDMEWLKASATACDTSTVYNMNGAVTTRPLFTADYAHTTDRPPSEIRDVMVEAMAGEWSWEGGLLKIGAGVYNPVQGQITEDWVIEGNVEIAPMRSIIDTFNTVQGRFMDETAGYIEKNYPTVQAAALVADDGAVYTTDVDFEAITHPGQAQHVAAVLIRDARQALTLSCVMNWRADQLGLMETWSVNLPRFFGTLTKKMRIISKRMTLDGGFEVAMRETGPDIFGVSSTFNVADSEPNTALPIWTVIPAPSVLQISSGTSFLSVASDGTVISGARVYWGDLGPRVQAVELAYIRADEIGAQIWLTQKFTAALGAADVVGLVDGVRYLFKIRSIGTLATSDWGVQVAHTVVGKLAPPSPVDQNSLSWSVEAGGIRLRWGAVADRDLAGYQLTVNGISQDVDYKSTSYLIGNLPAGANIVQIRARDTSGNFSQWTAYTVNVTAPSAVRNARANVIDNNVLLYWDAPDYGSLPIRDYLIRKGPTWESGNDIGSNADSTFSTVFESQGGTYTYWIVPRDFGGNLGPSVSVTTRVNQPPDYVLAANFISAFTGQKVNTVEISGALYGPTSADETDEFHFQSRGWSSDEDAIAAGYPGYWEPANSGSYTETIDYGAPLVGHTIRLDLSTVIVSGAPTFTTQISWRKTENDPWTSAPVNTTSALATEFRYVKLEVLISGLGLLRIDRIEIALSAKLRADRGTASANAADAGGTYVAFNDSFVSAFAPVVQPISNSSVSAVVDFNGSTPYPPGFRVFLFDSNGGRISGPFSWRVEGY